MEGSGRPVKGQLKNSEMQHLKDLASGRVDARVGLSGGGLGELPVNEEAEKRARGALSSFRP